MRLRRQHQFGGEQRALLILRHRCPFDDVGDELRAKWQRHFGTVQITYTPPVGDKQVISAGPAGDIDIFPELDIAFGAENEETAIAPGRQTIGREPIDADIAGAAVAA